MVGPKTGPDVSPRLVSSAPITTILGKGGAVITQVAVGVVRITTPVGLALDAVDSDILPIRAEAGKAGTTGLATDAGHRHQGPGFLGYALVIAGQSAITTITDLAGLSVGVTVTAGRSIRVSGYAGVYSSVADDTAELSIREGGTTLQVWDALCRPASTGVNAYPTVILTPSAGAHTYKLSLARVAGSGSLTMNAGTANPAFILVEDIGA